MASSDTPKTILLRGDPIYGEADATAAITPGMLVTPVGTIRTVSASPSVAPAIVGAVSATFARENETIGGDIDTPYAIADNVLFMTMRKGDMVYALLAAGQDVAAGAHLSAGAGGLLVAATAGSVTGAAPVTGVVLPTTVIAKALEAVDNNPGTGGAPVRIKVEIV